jgi:hypothetical protein
MGATQMQQFHEQQPSSVHFFQNSHLPTNQPERRL